MVRFSWINTSLFVILVLQFTAVTGQNSPSFTVKVGDEVTLPCENVINNQDKCDSTSWVVSRYIETTELVTHGKISKNEISKVKSDRMSVTENCSLVIKNVTDEDVGRYTCRQFNKSGQQQGPDSQVHLSVIIMKHFQNNDQVSLYCNVFTFGECGHTVEWLYQGDENDTATSQGSCSDIVVFTPRLNQNSNYSELLKCNVTDNKSGQMLLCSVGPQSSCQKTVRTTKSKGITTEGRNETLLTKVETTLKQVPGWWRYIIVSVVLAALSISVVAVKIWTKTKREQNTDG
ncbi:uncharacterized protein LOC119912684 [Micropterus salmoides]|uniref:uncharacterized protein LOC119912684 n=1 Tax=Micropterus salmoides TaxID=27706 RepID=UPI0018EB2EC8|nr:uncharacterized protein LOC119912684 [Micropterus salmoides]